MKTLFKLLFAPLLWLLQGCSPLGNPVDPEKSDSHYYNNSENEIRYSPMGNWFELGNTAMQVDVESFEVFNSALSRDKNQLYFDAYAVENIAVDLSSFQVKSEDFMTNMGIDKDHVYVFEMDYKDLKGYSTGQIVEGADPETYVQTEWGWGNDGTHHFYMYQMVDADFESFQKLNDNFAKDNSSAFVRNDTRFGSFDADLESLKILGESSHAIDRNNVYWLPFFTKNAPNLITIPYSERAEVTYLNRYFLKIGDAIFYDGFAKSDIDTKSFEIIDHSYAKDAVHVYYEDMAIPNADPKSFRRMEDSYKYMDDNGTYHEGKLVE